MRNGIVKRLLLTLALLLTLVACRLTATPLPVPDDALVVINGMVIDGTGADPIPDGVVVIQGDRVVAVGRAADFAIPAEVDAIDAAGGTIMPGIINSHVHSARSPETRRIFLTAGVTAVCDLGTQLFTISHFEKERTPSGPAARGFRAGPIITAPGGYPVPRDGDSISYEVSTPDEARTATVDLLERGVDVIKIAIDPGNPQEPWPMLNLEQVQAIVEEAHARNVLVRAHVQKAAVLDIVLGSGVDVIEHVPLPPSCWEPSFWETKTQSLPEDSGHVTLSPQLESQLTRLIEQGVIMVPTIDALVAGWYSAPDLTSAQQSWVDYTLEIVRRFHDLGGTVALGNDFGNPGVEVGMPMREMELLLEAGLTPMEVIEAGTSRAAGVCGHGDELGTLEPGKLADVIIVDGDPLMDIGVMERVTVVIKGGEVAYTSE